MNKKLIAIDVDRTLLKSDHTVSEQTRQFLSDLTDAGHIVVIATGRILSSARAVKDQLGLDISYVGCNGATIYDHIDKQVMADALDRDVVLKILDIFQKHDIYHHYYTEDVIYANRLAHTAKRFKIYEGTTTSVKHVKDIIIHDDLKETIDNNIVYKFGIFEDGTYDLNAVVEDLSKIDGIYPIYSNIGLLDVMKAGISKWTAIERLSKIHGIAPEDVIAFGDSPNDKEMIANAGIGVAMGNAVDEVKAVADRETLTSDEDGVYVFLKDYFKAHE